MLWPLILRGDFVIGSTVLLPTVGESIDVDGASIPPALKKVDKPAFNQTVDIFSKNT